MLQLIKKRKLYIKEMSINFAGCAPATNNSFLLSQRMTSYFDARYLNTDEEIPEMKKLATRINSTERRLTAIEPVVAMQGNRITAYAGKVGEILGKVSTLEALELKVSALEQKNTEQRVQISEFMRLASAQNDRISTLDRRVTAHDAIEGRVTALEALLAPSGRLDARISALELKNGAREARIAYLERKNVALEERINAFGARINDLEVRTNTHTGRINVNTDRISANIEQINTQITRINTQTERIGALDAKIHAPGSRVIVEMPQPEEDDRKKRKL